MASISVITICYNAATEIQVTVESVINQVYPDIEYIVIDGGSSDGTLPILESYGSSIDVLVSEPDGGIYDAMNKGLRRSTGDAIIFMNAGDYFYSNHVVGLFAEYLSRNPDGDVFYGDLAVRDPDGASSVFTPPPPEEALKFLIGGSLPHQATFARRRAFARTGLFDTRYRSHADYDWFLKVATDGGLQLRRMPFCVASFGLGGASSQLERGERERHGIQNGNPVLSTQRWSRRRVEIYQEIYLSQRLELERLRASAAA